MDEPTSQNRASRETVKYHLSGKCVNGPEQSADYASYRRTRGQMEVAARARLAPCSTTLFPRFTGHPLIPHKIRSKIRINDSC